MTPLRVTSNLVSIITPVYNAESFLHDTIQTVQNQTYSNWELILVDDQSLDASVEIIRSYQVSDKRIKLIQLKKNSGAAIARNAGTESAKGRYLAFLDADDLWKSNKIEKQIEYMNDTGTAFLFTAYEFADHLGMTSGKVVTIPNSLTYEQSLKNPIMWTSTIILDLNKIEKKLAIMPNVRRGQDAATWWSILRQTGLSAHGLSMPLAYYRRTNSSLSANKWQAVRRTWYLYREVEKLNLLKSAYVFTYYAYNAVRKRV